ncbi:MAG: hypothetical protein J5586_01005 [Clostridia bacterium]|nr:hypothetical protein [Clostridia bacterium]
MSGKKRFTDPAMRPVSAMETTGSVPTPPLDLGGLESYEELEAIPSVERPRRFSRPTGER